MAKQTVKEPPAARQKSGAAKTAPRPKSKSLIIKGCGARFNGVYDLDKLLIKFLAFAAAACVLGLLCL